MRLMVFSVLDKQVGAFTPPQSFRSKGEAIRSFMDACKQEGSPFNKHAGDYVFYQLGTFDDQSGVLEPNLQQVITALECVSSVS